MFVLLNIFWFFRTSKYVLFWLYLWQLKEYHVGRIIDYFRTNRGRKSLFGILQIVKVVFLFLLIINSSLFDYLFAVLFFIYLSESIIFFVSAVARIIKRPVATLKIFFLTIVSFSVIFLFLAATSTLSDESQLFWLLLFDILMPVIISLVVLLFQPFFVIARNVMLEKARKKIENIKSVSGLRAIAITGSYGKTSTKEFLSTILSKKYKVLATKNHQNSEIGIAKYILKELNPRHQIFIAEVGAYNKGKVKEVCSMIKPKIGLVTGVNEQHLALFGSMENLLSAEGGGELAECLPRDGMLAVNGDNKYCLELLKKSDNLPPAQEKSYSMNKNMINADVWSEDIEVKRNYISFVVSDKNKNLAHFNVNVLGRHNAQNLLGAILVASELGMNFDEISEAAKSIKPEQAGMVLKHGKHGIYIIDSSYSANPDGVIADLDYLKIFPGKRVIVMPSLIELGPMSPAIHKQLGKRIAQVCNLVIVTSKDKFKDLKQGALSAGMPEKNILFYENPQDIYSVITIFCKTNDTVLLEGRVPAKLIDLLTL